MSTIYKTKLISSRDEGLLSFIEDTYDERQLSEIIWDSQELRIKPIIGTGLYDELLSQVRGSTLTSLNQTLLFTYINPVLKYYILCDGAPLFTYKLRNKGIVTQSSDNAQPANISEIDRLVRLYEDKAQSYADRLMNYLIQNNTSYPLYYNPGDGVDTIYPKQNQFNIGWRLGKITSKYNPCDNDKTIDF